MFSRPIGMKGNTTVNTGDTYRSYWMTCIARCLKEGDLSLFDDIGYYRVLGEETLVPNNEIMQLTADLPNWKQKRVSQIAKNYKKVWIDLHNEAVELSYIYTADLILGTFHDYSIAQSIKIFADRIQPEPDLSDTSKQLIELICLNRDEQIGTNCLMSPMGNNRGLSIWQKQKRFSVSIGGAQNHTRQARQSVTIVHHKDKSVRITIPVPSDSDNSDSSSSD